MTNVLEIHIFITQFFHKFDLRTTMLVRKQRFIHFPFLNFFLHLVLFSHFHFIFLAMLTFLSRLFHLSSSRLYFPSLLFFIFSPCFAHYSPFFILPLLAFFISLSLLSFSLLLSLLYFIFPLSLSFLLFCFCLSFNFCHLIIFCLFLSIN